MILAYRIHYVVGFTPWEQIALHRLARGSGLASSADSDPPTGLAALAAVAWGDR